MHDPLIMSGRGGIPLNMAKPARMREPGHAAEELERARHPRARHARRRRLRRRRRPLLARRHDARRSASATAPTARARRRCRSCWSPRASTSRPTTCRTTRARPTSCTCSRSCRAATEDAVRRLRAARARPPAAGHPGARHRVDRDRRRELPRDGLQHPRGPARRGRDGRRRARRCARRWKQRGVEVHAYDGTRPLPQGRRRADVPHRAAAARPERLLRTGTSEHARQESIVREKLPERREQRVAVRVQLEVARGRGRELAGHADLLDVLGCRAAHSCRWASTRSATLGGERAVQIGGDELDDLPAADPARDDRAVAVTPRRPRSSARARRAPSSARGAAARAGCRAELERRADLLRVPALDVAQDDDLLLARRQLGDRGPHLLERLAGQQPLLRAGALCGGIAPAAGVQRVVGAAGSGPGRRRARPRASGASEDSGTLRALPFPARARAVGDDAQDPGLQAGAALEAVQALEDAEPRLLDDLLGDGAACGRG